MTEDTKPLDGRKQCELGSPLSPEDLEGVKRLARGVQFVCAGCGRASNDADTLCKPSSMD